jgi:hypothetical protein
MPPLLLRPAATEVDWEIIKGESFDIRLPVLDADDVPVDVTGWTAKAQVRRSEHESVLHEWSATAGNATVAATTVTLHVDGAATTEWGWTNAQVSVEIYAPVTNKPHVIAQGVIRALPEITR